MTDLKSLAFFVVPWSQKFMHLANSCKKSYDNVPRFGQSRASLFQLQVRERDLVLF